MFVGHYGVSFAAKTLDRAMPLWLLFLAVQWLDVVWAPLVLLGVEKVRIVPGITASNPLDLYYMPYTHSLVAALLWSAAASVIHRVVTGRKDAMAATVIAGAVFSHWLLDFVVHRPDLPFTTTRQRSALASGTIPASRSRWRRRFSSVGCTSTSERVSPAECRSSSSGS